jgi:hypothetical protein
MQSNLVRCSTRMAHLSFSCCLLEYTPIYAAYALSSLISTFSKGTILKIWTCDVLLVDCCFELLSASSSTDELPGGATWKPQLFTTHILSPPHALECWFAFGLLCYKGVAIASLPLWTCQRQATSRGTSTFRYPWNHKPWARHPCNTLAFQLLILHHQHQLLIQTASPQSLSTGHQTRDPVLEAFANVGYQGPQSRVPVPEAFASVGFAPPLALPWLLTLAWPDEAQVRRSK